MLCEKKKSRRMPKIYVFLIILLGALVLIGCGINNSRHEAYSAYASIYDKEERDLTSDEVKRIDEAAKRLAKKRRGEERPNEDDYLTLTSYFKAKAVQQEDGEALDMEQRDIEEMLNTDEADDEAAEESVEEKKSIDPKMRDIAQEVAEIGEWMEQHPPGDEDDFTPDPEGEAKTQRLQELSDQLEERWKEIGTDEDTPEKALYNRMQEGFGSIPGSAEKIKKLLDKYE